MGAKRERGLWGLHIMGLGFFVGCSLLRLMENMQIRKERELHSSAWCGREACQLLRKRCSHGSSKGLTRRYVVGSTWGERQRNERAGR